MSVKEILETASKLEVVITGKDGETKIVSIEEASEILAASGDKFQIIKKANGEEQVLDNFMALKNGDTLEISFLSGETLSLDNFYSYNNVEITFSAPDKSIYTISSQSSFGQELHGNTSLVYAQGEQQSLLDMVHSNQPLHKALKEQISVNNADHFAAAETAAAGSAAGTTAAAGTVAGVSTAAVVGTVVGVAAVGAAVSNSSSSSSSSDSSGSSSSQGQFIDSAVGGADVYVNGELVDTTDENGYFNYTAEDTDVITFAIGGTTLGSMTGAEIPSDGKIMPQDIVGVDRNDTSNAEVVKMARFLQTLDSDGDASNGITIEKNNDGDIVDGDGDVLLDATTVANLVDTADLTTVLEDDGDTALVSEAAAKAHLLDTLSGDTTLLGLSADGEIVTITLDDTTLTTGESATVTFNFSDAPAAFTSADLIVQNGTLSAINEAADGVITEFTATFTPDVIYTDATNMISIDPASVNLAGYLGQSGNYIVDTANLTIDPISTDDMVNATEDNTAVTISGTTVGVADGTTVTITILGEEYTTTVSSDAWTQNIFLTSIDGIVDGEITVTADIKDGETVVLEESTTFTYDTTAPTLTAVVADGDTNTITLTYSETLDSVNLPLANEFTVTTDTNPNVVASVAVDGDTLTLTMTDDFDSGAAVTVLYTDEAGDTVNAIQDSAGNDAGNIAIESALVADGYVKFARLYIKTDDPSFTLTAVDELGGEMLYDTGVDTDEYGNFIFTQAVPDGSLVAVGGFNIDTGVPNTMPLRAPEGSTVINPLTTLTQQIVDNAQESGEEVTPEEAQELVKTAMGIDPDTDLSSYDPIADDSEAGVAAQKAAATIATIATMASSTSTDAQAQQEAQNQVLNNLVAQVDQGSALNFNDANVVEELLDGVELDAAAKSDVADASSQIAQAENLDQITSAQSQFLDKVAPGKGTIEDTIENDSNATNDTTPTIKINLDTESTDGKAAVIGDKLNLLLNGEPAADVILTEENIQDGFVEFTLDELAEGTYEISANLVDRAGNIGEFYDTYAITIDTTAPTDLTIEPVAGDDIINISEYPFAYGIAGNLTQNPVIISGTVEDAVSVTVNGEAATINGDTWSFNLTKEMADEFGEGLESLEIIARDTAGNEQTIDHDITIDTIESTATIEITSINDNVNNENDETVDVRNSGVTDDNTLEFNGTISNYNTGDKVVIQSFFFDDYGNNVYEDLGYADIDVDNGTWSFVTPTLSNVSYDFAAVVSDAAGNLSDVVSSGLISVNATAPEATVTGLTFNNLHTNTPTVSFYIDQPLADGEFIKVFVDGEYIGDAVENPLDTNTPYMYTFGNLVDGEYEIQAVVENNVGNQGTMSDTREFAVDTIAPTVEITDNKEDVTNGDITFNIKFSEAIADPQMLMLVDGYLVENGTISYIYTENDSEFEVIVTPDSGITDDVTLSINPDYASSIFDGHSNAISIDEINTSVHSQAVDTQAPTTLVINNINETNTINKAQKEAGELLLTGTTEENTAVILNFGGSNTIVVESDNDGDWEYTLGNAEFKSLDLSQGVITATAKDAVGNETDPVSITLTLDIDAPFLSPIEFVTDDGIGRISSDTTPTIRFEAEVGATLSYVVNGGEFIDLDVLATGAPQEITLDEIDADGEVVIQLKATDPSGNESIRETVFTLDSGTEDLMILGLEEDTFVEDEDGIFTNQPEFIFDGLEPGSAILYSVNDGAWTEQPDFSLDGEYTVQVKQRDLAGNESENPSDPFTFTLITQNPIYTVSVTGFIDTGVEGDDITTEKLQDITGELVDDTGIAIAGLENGEKVYGALGLDLNDVEWVELDVDGAQVLWEEIELADGLNFIAFKVVDRLGNEGNITETMIQVFSGEVTNEINDLHLDPDTGAFGDNITNDPMAVIKGSLLAPLLDNEELQYQMGDSEWMSVPAGTITNGIQITLPISQDEGEQTIQLKIVNTTLGIEGELFEITTELDQTPDEDVTVEVAEMIYNTLDGISFTVTGLDEGSVAKIRFINEFTDAADPGFVDDFEFTDPVAADFSEEYDFVADMDGIYDIDLPEDLANSQVTVEYMVEDIAGNISYHTGSVFVVDTAPAEPALENPIVYNEADNTIVFSFNEFVYVDSVMLEEISFDSDEATFGENSELMAEDEVEGLATTFVITLGDGAVMTDDITTFIVDGVTDQAMNTNEVVFDVQQANIPVTDITPPMVELFIGDQLIDDDGLVIDLGETDGTIQVVASELLDINTLTLTSTPSLNVQQGAIYMGPNEHNQYIYQFDTDPMESGVSYEFRVSGIQDLAGNTTEDLIAEIDTVNSVTNEQPMLELEMLGDAGNEIPTLYLKADSTVNVDLNSFVEDADGDDVTLTIIDDTLDTQNNQLTISPAGILSGSVDEEGSIGTIIVSLDDGISGPVEYTIDVQSIPESQIIEDDMDHDDEFIPENLVTGDPDGTTDFTAATILGGDPISFFEVEEKGEFAEFYVAPIGALMDHYLDDTTPSEEEDVDFTSVGDYTLQMTGIEGTETIEFNPLSAMAVTSIDGVNTPDLFQVDVTLTFTDVPTVEESDDWWETYYQIHDDASAQPVDITDLETLAQEFVESEYMTVSTESEEFDEVKLLADGTVVAVTFEYDGTLHSTNENAMIQYRENSNLVLGDEVGTWNHDSYEDDGYLKVTLDDGAVTAFKEDDGEILQTEINAPGDSREVTLYYGVDTATFKGYLQSIQGSEEENQEPTGTVTIVDDNGGDIEVGDILSVNSTLVDPDGISGDFNYSWYVNGDEVVGEFGDSYEVIQEDIGKTITVEVSYEDDAGNDESMMSAPTAAVVDNGGDPVDPDETQAPYPYNITHVPVEGADPDTPDIPTLYVPEGEEVNISLLYYTHDDQGDDVTVNVVSNTLDSGADNDVLISASGMIEGIINTDGEIVVDLSDGTNEARYTIEVIAVPENLIDEDMDDDFVLEPLVDSTETREFSIADAITAGTKFLEVDYDEVEEFALAAGDNAGTLIEYDASLGINDPMDEESVTYTALSANELQLETVDGTETLTFGTTVTNITSLNGIATTGLQSVEVVFAYTDVPTLETSTDWWETDFNIYDDTGAPTPITDLNALEEQLILEDGDLTVETEHENYEEVKLLSNGTVVAVEHVSDGTLNPYMDETETERYQENVHKEYGVEVIGNWENTTTDGTDGHIIVTLDAGVDQTTGAITAFKVDNGEIVETQINALGYSQTETLYFGMDTAGFLDLLNDLHGDGDDTPADPEDMEDPVFLSEAVDTLTGTDANDVYVAVGITADGQYSGEDENFDDLTTINNNEVSDVNFGDSIDGGEGYNVLHVYGIADLSLATLENIDDVILHSDVTFSIVQINALNTNGATISGDGGSTLRIADNIELDQATVDMSALTLDNLGQVEIGANTTATMSQENIDAIQTVSSSFTNAKIQAAAADLDFTGKNVFGDAQVLNSAGQDQGTLQDTTAANIGDIIDTMNDVIDGINTLLDGTPFTSYQQSEVVESNYSLVCDDLAQGGVILGREDSRNFLSGGSQADTIIGGQDLTNFIYAGTEAVDDAIENHMFGGDSRDFIAGGVNSDKIEAGDGDDFMYGGDGDDIFRGGAGSDFINMGTGSDTIVFEADIAGATEDDIDFMLSDDLSAGVDGDVFDFALAAQEGVFDGQTAEVLVTSTNDLATSLNTQAVVVLTGINGDDSDLEIVFNNTALDTTNIGYKILVWSPDNATHVQIGLLSNLDETDNNSLSIQTLAIIGGFDPALAGVADYLAGLTIDNFNLELEAPIDDTPPNANATDPVQVDQQDGTDPDSYDAGDIIYISFDEPVEEVIGAITLDGTDATLGSSTVVPQDVTNGYTTTFAITLAADAVIAADTQHIFVASATDQNQNTGNNIQFALPSLDAGGGDQSDGGIGLDIYNHIEDPTDSEADLPIFYLKEGVSVAIDLNDYINYDNPDDVSITLDDDTDLPDGFTYNNGVITVAAVASLESGSISVTFTDDVADPVVSSPYTIALQVIESDLVEDYDDEDFIAEAQTDDTVAVTQSFATADILTNGFSFFETEEEGEFAEITINSGDTGTGTIADYELDEDTQEDPENVTFTNDTGVLKMSSSEGSETIEFADDAIAVTSLNGVKTPGLFQVTVDFTKTAVPTFPDDIDDMDWWTTHYQIWDETLNGGDGGNRDVTTLDDLADLLVNDEYNTVSTESDTYNDVKLKDDGTVVAATRIPTGILNPNMDGDDNIIGFHENEEIELGETSIGTWNEADYNTDGALIVTLTSGEVTAFAIDPIDGLVQTEIEAVGNTWSETVYYGVDQAEFEEVFTLIDALDVEQDGDNYEISVEDGIDLDLSDLAYDNDLLEIDTVNGETDSLTLTVDDVLDLGVAGKLYINLGNLDNISIDGDTDLTNGIDGWTSSAPETVDGVDYVTFTNGPATIAISQETEVVAP